MDRARDVNRRIATIEKKLDTAETIARSVKDAYELMELAEESGDPDIAAEVEEHLDSLEKDAKAFFLEALMRGKYDSNNAILTIHAGAGGTEAQDWAEMLYRMYTRYAEREGYGVQVMDYQAGDEAGIKSVTFMIVGNNAYGYLKAEKGVHRLVRISPFDANKRRHTSFASVEVMPGNSKRHRNKDKSRRDKGGNLQEQRRGRAECQQGGNGCAHNPPSHGHSYLVPEREKPASEQGNRNEDAYLQTYRAKRARKDGGGAEAERRA